MCSEWDALIDNNWFWAVYYEYHWGPYYFSAQVGGGGCVNFFKLIFFDFSIFKAGVRGSGLVVVVVVIGRLFKRGLGRWRGRSLHAF